MKEVKRFALRLFLGGEIVVATFFYLCGSGGLESHRRADFQNNELCQEVKTAEVEVSSLENELHERKTNPYYKESIARKELQMAYKDEMIYLLPKG